MAAPPPYDFEKSKDYGQGYANQGKSADQKLLAKIF